jgi:integrase/recombinase XerC
MASQQLTRHTISNRDVNSHTVTSLTLSQAIQYFTASLTKPGNYPRIVRAYLEFCLQQGYGFDLLSLNLYAVGLTPNRISPVRKFLMWYQLQGQPTIRLDPPPQPKAIPAADRLILQFLADPETRLVDSSKETYTRIFNNFFAFILAARTQNETAGFTATTVRAFLSSPAQARPGVARSVSQPAKPLSAFTYNVYLSAIKQLAQWVIDHPQEQELALTQLQELQRIGRLSGKKIPKGFYKDSLEGDERAVLLAQIQDPAERAMVSLMAWGGLRTTEVVRLQMEDVDLKKNRLFVLGKGKHVKEAIKLPAICAQFIQDYFRTIPKFTATDPLFGGLTTRSIRYRVGKYIQLAGLVRARLSAHSLRHTAAQRLLDEGAEPITVQRHLRHQHFDTTQGYVRKKTDEDYFDQIK